MRRSQSTTNNEVLDYCCSSLITGSGLLLVRRSLVITYGRNTFGTCVGYAFWFPGRLSISAIRPAVNRQSLILVYSSHNDHDLSERSFTLFTLILMAALATTTAPGSYCLSAIFVLSFNNLPLRTTKFKQHFSVKAHFLTFTSSSLSSTRRCRQITVILHDFELASASSHSLTSDKERPPNC